MASNGDQESPLKKVDSWGRHRGKRVPMEAALLGKVQHIPGVIRLYDCFTNDYSFFMIMELIPEALSLYDYIEDDNDIPIDEVRRLFTEIVKIVKSCMEAGISHKDIKPENILLFRDKNTGRFDVKLIDFGCGEYVRSYKGSDTGGTRIYWPPEYIRGGRFLHVPATVWSLGTLLYYLICRDDPFHSNESIQKADPPFPKNVPRPCRDLIMRCFVKDPWERLSFNGILSHPWLKVKDLDVHLELETAKVLKNRTPKKNPRVKQK
ncbi:serine/threonine-protein kinase pim-1-like [Oratosquilla oratoria]|uniref:serine/threonine-protein kinase pim-1-like n=1 Tax=Oratosquilla oratoria TaxID=337810 RepID=UPI003F776331